MAKKSNKSLFSRILKWFLRSLAGLVVVFIVLFQVFPGFRHVVLYYCGETQDWFLQICGMAPHYDNLDLGAPEGQKVDRIFNREGYAFGYSEQHEQPLWVIYKLTAAELENKRAARTDDFREDPRILTRSASPDDYKGSGYDRGHLAPAADMGWTTDVMSESFYMSNMSPQTPECNRGIWVDLESQVRDFARAEKEVLVVTGPIFYPGREVKSIGVTSRVSVPHAYYKVVYDLTPPCKMIAFVIPNEKGTKTLPQYAVTVRTVENLTGLTFFPALSPDQEKLKKTISLTDWSWSKRK